MQPYSYGFLVEEDEKWQRGCKMLINQTLGCSQHKWFHDDKETVVDECVCNTNLCNEEMDPIPDKTSTKKPTSPDGIT